MNNNEIGAWIKDGDVKRCSLCQAVLEGDAIHRNNYYCYHCGILMRNPYAGMNALDKYIPIIPDYYF